MNILVATGCQNSPTQLPPVLTATQVTPTQETFGQFDDGGDDNGDDRDELDSLNISPVNRDATADEFYATLYDEPGDLIDIRDTRESFVREHAPLH